MSHFSADVSHRWRKIWQRYGLTPESYAALLAAQGGRCAICRQPPKHSLWVDHDHKTNRVRGLLCAGCNTLVGFLDRNPGAVAMAQVYLANHVA